MTRNQEQAGAATRAGRAHPCPACGSASVAAIMYGYPAFSEDLNVALGAGEVSLGGCVVMPGQPDLVCNACGNAFRIDEAEIRLEEDEADPG